MKLRVIKDMSPPECSGHKSVIDEPEFLQRPVAQENQNKVSVKPSIPQVCLGMPLYNQTQFLPEALSSILAQTYRDFQLFVVDDSTEAEPQAIIEKFATRDNRIVYLKNRSRKGMVDNWKTCCQQAGRPDYFAWVSDHDVWHPQWLESMVLALNSNPEAVLAYPRWVSIDNEGRKESPKKSATFSTNGLNEAQKIRAVCRDAPKFGYMVYGLFRAPAMRRCGIFRRVLFPDAILMYELCLQGDFVQVDDELWYRRKNAAFSIARQKQSLFIRKPWYIFLPWPLVNAAALAWNTVVQPPTRNLRYRYGGLKIAVSYLLRQLGRLGEGSWIGSYHEWRHAKKPWIKKLKKRLKNRRLSNTA
jgi:glycosyltransferase involved in cell wall biosynthesis